jgi:hypothetical protein
MLKEIVLNDHERRWFSSAEEDLYVYLDDEGGIESVEYCYGKSRDEHVLIVKSGNQLSHMRVDDGEQKMGSYKGSPIYVLNGSFGLNQIISDLSDGIDHLSDKEKNRIISFIRENTRHIGLQR